MNIKKFLREEINRAFQENIKSKYGLEIEEPEEELNPEDLFGDESIQALSDIESEYGEEETAEFGSMEDIKQFVKSITQK